MHLEIIQRTDATEMVNSTVVEKLYQLAYENIDLGILSQLDLTSNLEGNISPNAAYKDSVDYLREKFPNLYITISDNDCYIRFADDNVKNILLNSGIGDGIGITLAQAANATIGTALRGNTTITSFDEFGYFSRANSSPANEMFNGCTNLESIDLSNTTSIANKLFANTALTTLSIPNLQTLSGKDQFNTCTKLTEVLNLGSIISIPIGAFYNCPLLTDVVLPESCTSIDSSVFTNDSLLLNINLQNIAFIGKDAFRNCTGLRDEMDLRNVVSIATNAFNNTNVSGILNLPKLQTLNGNYIFYQTKISGVECLGKVNKLEGAFRDCINLLYAKIPYECTTLDYDTFLNCNNVTSIKQYTDSIDNWIEGEEPTTGPLSRVTSFGVNCFVNCRHLLLTQLDIQNATTIGKNSFNGTLFSGPIDLSNASSIGEGAFANTKITSVNLGHNITSLPDNCFSGCTNLTHIYGLENVTFIGTHFASASALFSSTDVLHFDNVTSCSGAITNYQRWNDTYTCHMYFPKLTTMPGSYSDNSTYHDGFFTTRGEFRCSFVYFRDISVVKPGTFSYVYITSFVINNTTPPSVTGIEAGEWKKLLDRIFDGSQIENIYVPDESISAYQNSDFLSSYLLNGYTKNNVLMYPQLRGMSELTHYATEADWVTAGKPVDGIIDAYM